jgi:two-component system chemotaxis response regulator CheY
MYKILIVDDSPTVRAAVKGALAYKKAEIFEAGTAVDAVKVFEQERPGLIFLDINLPAADGFVALRRIRMIDTNRDTKVVMLTGVTDKATVQRSMEEGADDYVGKPFTPVVLRDKTDKFLK